MMKKHILLIDDDFIFNYVARLMLERTNRVGTVSTAMNGKEAIRELHKTIEGTAPVPDLIFIDINMPVMNGFQFIKAFQDMDFPGKERISLVMVTSSLDPRDIEEAKSLGVNKYYSKPLTDADIEAVLAG